MKTVKPLLGHTSEDSAYIVDDYPYGYSLRCKIRYWIESHPKRGFRSVSQTTNPKRGDIWNKPKRSTYTTIALGMYLNEDNHVRFCGLSEYSSLRDSIEFKEDYYDCLNQSAKDSLDVWIIAKTGYNEACKRGEVSYQIGEKSGLIEADDVGTEALEQARADLKQRNAA